MGEFLAWHGRLAEAGVPVLIRAPLVHLYLERIHPFWDGNGHVGRMLEASLLLAAGFDYSHLVDRLLRDKAINARQYAILDRLREATKPLTLAELRRSPWYLALYARLADKTKQRDLRALRELGLLRPDEAGQARIQFARD